MADASTRSDQDSAGAGSGDGEPTEIELKLVIDPAHADAVAASPLLAGVVPIARPQRSVYFDTPDGILRTTGLALRVRHIGDRRVQTLKAGDGPAAGLFVRPEWEQEIEGDTPLIADFASPLQTLVAADELARLQPAFDVDVVRRTVEIPSGAGIIELVIDTGTVASGEASDDVSEIELELKGGEPDALFSFARALNEDVPLRLGVLTKSERGYRLLDGLADKAVKSQPIALADTMTTADGFAAIAQGCLRQFRLNEDILLRTDGGSALHQTRVALRRLRSAFSIFKPVVGDDLFEHLRGELRWLAGTLGEARNIDVLLARIGSRRLAKPLRIAREAAYAQVHAALDSQRARLLMIDLVEWIALGPWRSDAARAEVRDAELTGFAGDVLERYRRKVKRGGRKLARLDDDHRHKVRIEAKKLRYAVEFFASLYAKPKAQRRHAKFLGALEGLQSNLGDLNDLATEPGVLEQLGLTGSATAQALAGDHQSRASLIGKAADAHAELIDVKRFWG